MERLFRSHISFQQTVQDDSHRHSKAWLNMEIAPEGELWWDPKRPDQGALWQSWILLGEKLYDAIATLTAHTPAPATIPRNPFTQVANFPSPAIPLKINPLTQFHLPR
jgi:hypothetical protein